MEIKTIVLSRRKESSVQRKHPWIFSGAINRIISNTGEAPISGELVEVVDINNNFLALGYFSEGTIAIRIISFKKEEINQEFWNKKIQAAYNVREILGLTNTNKTNIYRLMHAEGDGISGLIIDFYNGTAIIQAHTIGVYNAIDEISLALQHVYNHKLIAIYNKSAESIARQTSETVENDYIYTNGKPNLIGLDVKFHKVVVLN